MLISIGILAWNEEERLQGTLTSLFQQSVFSADTSMVGVKWEVVVVPNGCTDRTAEIATSTLSTLVAKDSSSSIQWAVCSVAEPGKSNAWNLFVHNYSDKSANYFLMLDADIEFGQRDTIANTVKTMLEQGDADVVVDQPLKDAEKKVNKSLIENISIAASKSNNSREPAIAGSFYFARASVMRGIWIPKGLTNEDGFVKAMILTNLFRSEVDGRKIVRAPNASHYFETLTSLRAIFRHEVRIVIGSTLNLYFTWDFLKFATDPTTEGAGILIKNQMDANPSWYVNFIANTIKSKGFWVLPPGSFLRRFRMNHAPANRTMQARLKSGLVAVLGFIIDIPILLVANQKLKNGSAMGHW